MRRPQRHGLSLWRRREAGGRPGRGSRRVYARIERNVLQAADGRGRDGRVVANVLRQPDRVDRVPDVELEHGAAAVTGVRRAVLTRMADIDPKDVDWAWLQRKARGLLNLTVGDPGLGKTFLLLDMSPGSRVARAGPMADARR